MKINSMELLSKSGRVVAVSGGSTNMEREKVTRHGKIQMEELATISSRIIVSTVTEFKHTMMEKDIEDSSLMTGLTVMDS